MRYSQTRQQVASLTQINNELEKIAVSIDDMASRKPDDGPNQLEVTLDANSQRIINLPAPATSTEPVRKADFDVLGSQLTGEVDTAVANAEAATENANTAAGAANTASSNANTATSAAYQAIDDLEEKSTAVLQSTGWFVAGAFADGFTFTAYNQVGRDADGQMWSYNGELPFTVTAGTVPSEPDYTNRGDAALRSNLANELVPSLAYGDDDKTYKRISAVLRQTAAAGGWSALNDTGHASTGIDTLTISGKDLVMAYDFSASKVSHLTLTPDETYASQGLIFGASVGASSATIRAYAPLSGRVSSGLLDYNTTLGQVVSSVVDAPNGTIVVTHNGRPVVPQAVNITKGNFLSNGEFVVSANTSTSFTMQWTAPLAGRFAYNGTDFVLSESSNVAGSVTAEWNSTLNCMRVSHPSVGNSNTPLSVTQSRDASTTYLIKVDTVSNASFDVFFYDLTGALITSPTTSMIVYVSRNSNIPSVIPTTTNLAYWDAGLIRCDMNQLYSTGANIWVDGLMLK